MGLGDKPKYDIVTILIYAALVFIGFFSIYSAAPVTEYTSIFDISQVYGKQLLFIGVCTVFIIIILAVEVKFYERFAGLIYVISLVSLAGLYVFGKEVNGAISWYPIGSFTFQPSEFAKFATALAVAKYLSQLDVSLKNVRDFMIVAAIIALPALLIVPQPDPGSALIYAAFFFALHREGLSPWYLSLGVIALALFLGALVIHIGWIILMILSVVVVMYLLSRKRKHKKRLPKPRVYLYVIAAVLCIAYTFSTSYIFNNVLEDRHRNRIDIVLGRVQDDAGIGYNINQSMIAIGNGGIIGKPLEEATQTRGGYVPEQHTDFIFSAIGEVSGLLGTSVTILLFVFLIYRVIIMAERQRNQFARIYGYGVAGIFFLHFFVNVGMVIGLLPTVGIPLPFMSYGGSGLMGFTILLFIFIKLDAHRMSYEH
ncbi:rod shape determining protein RodA [Nonlabens dokdonensis]|jgi:rod shape determining protein RodA|uniref:Rod shape-determining membrane protein RodA n=2 Tax=Nonlabens dokdonensis TaxID=328515 RepID=L7WB36_NONDD|nr:rod shape-determining protein RodA [Nonlabens dokdonensis]AGC77106.1 rod shape-determining membrane protein RodA [Nonlabens dokdonensis DSW-6]PZX41065.1 rod shape determining protein RodA [Nonlabens dokdonensis]